MLAIPIRAELTQISRRNSRNDGVTDRYIIFDKMHLSPFRDCCQLSLFLLCLWIDDTYFTDRYIIFDKIHISLPSLTAANFPSISDVGNTCPMGELRHNSCTSSRDDGVKRRNVNFMIL
jgi:hypothetical protein